MRKLRTWTRLPIVLAAVLAVGACSKKDDSVCARYADFEVRCGDIPKSEAESTRMLAKSFCEAARKEKAEPKRDTDEDNPLSPMIAQESECARTAKGCEDYKACTDKLHPALDEDDDEEATPVSPGGPGGNDAPAGPTPPVVPPTAPPATPP